MVYAMAGASERHNIIKLNVAGFLNSAVAETCRVFDGDMKLLIQHGEECRFYYPDVFVSCDGNDDEQYFRNSAVLVIEVLSPTTKRLDRYEKFEAYKTLSSLLEYVLIDQEMPKIEIFRRSQSWQREVFFPEQAVRFDSAGLTLTFEQIYRRVTFSSG